MGLFGLDDAVIGGIGGDGGRGGVGASFWCLWVNFHIFIMGDWDQYWRSPQILQHQNQPYSAYKFHLIHYLSAQNPQLKIDS